MNYESEREELIKQNTELREQVAKLTQQRTMSESRAQKEPEREELLRTNAELKELLLKLN